MRSAIKVILIVSSAYVFPLAASIFWQLNFTNLFLLWLTAWISVEIAAICSGGRSYRLLRHLRYGPLTTFLFFSVSVLTYDQAMIVYSKWQIRQYVYAAGPDALPPRLKLHTDYRGWCGNGFFASIYSEYGPIAAEGFESSDPAVRARSLRASYEVYDSINGSMDGPFPDLVRRANRDLDPSVRMIAVEIESQLSLR